VVVEVVGILVESAVQVFKGDSHSELSAWFEQEGAEDEPGEEEVRDVHKGVVVGELLADGVVVVALVDDLAGHLALLAHEVVGTVTVGSILVVETDASVEAGALCGLEGCALSPKDQDNDDDSKHNVSMINIDYRRGLEVPFILR